MDEMSSPLLSQLKEPSIIPSPPHQYLHIDPNWKPFTSEQLRQIEIAHEIANEVDMLLQVYLKHISNYSESLGIQKFQSNILMNYAIIHKFSKEELPPDIQTLFSLIFNFYESFNDINQLQEEVVKKTRHKILSHFFNISGKHLDLQDPEVKDIYNKSRMYKASFKKQAKIPTIKQFLARQKDELFMNYCEENQIVTFQKFSACTFENKILKPKLKEFCLILETELRQLEGKLRDHLNSSFFTFSIECPMIFGEAQTQIYMGSLKYLIEDTSSKIVDIQKFALKLEQPDSLTLDESYYRKKFKKFLQK
ncbi:hypothetical protein [Acinetobacter junii]|uniref:Uncharacterized protein n=1 Tax=Acinetobacter junii TaxID=40215 RepID=A0AAX1MFH3_ACIJU|nr:hypothetical protein [Acinetobacter junii]QUY35875.1 hypothetical protein H2677_11490 [Acinetobacter junii]